MPLEIIANTTEKQVIYHKELKITQAIFYQASSLDNNNGLLLEADKEMVIMIDESDSNVFKIYYANPIKRPENEISFANIKINRRLLDEDNDVVIDQMTGMTDITLDFETDLDFETKPQEKIILYLSRNFLIRVKGK